jgi:hypothetical protein
MLRGDETSGLVCCMCGKGGIPLTTGGGKEPVTNAQKAQVDENIKSS